MKFRDFTRKLLLAASLVASLTFTVSFAIVPTPAPDQSGPIALTGAIIHVGDGTVIGDGVITFDEGTITAVGSASNTIDLTDHEVFDLQGRHVYPGFVLPNTSSGFD